MAHQKAIDRENYAHHPEKLYTNLIDCPLGRPANPEDSKKLRAGRYANNDEERATELCWSCGWTVGCQHLGYSSRLRISYVRDNVGLWEVGSRWMIRDQPNDEWVGNDFITQEFLRKQPDLDIPLVEEMRKLSKPTDKVQITLMLRAEGVGLDTIWHTLSPEEKSSYRDQLANAMKQWRQFKSPIAKKVNGDMLDDCIIAHCSTIAPPTCKKIGRTTEEWLSNLEGTLRLGLCDLYNTKDPLIINEKFQELKRNFPNSEPYVLTHGDLNLSNIIVKDGKIQAILDWQQSGFFPWWAERWMSLTHGFYGMNEFFEPFWRDSKVGWEMDEDTFQTEIFEKVGPAHQAYDDADVYVIHEEQGPRWERTAFCECKPWRGRVNFDDIGIYSEHQLSETPHANLGGWV